MHALTGVDDNGSFVTVLPIEAVNLRRNLQDRSPGTSGFVNTDDSITVDEINIAARAVQSMQLVFRSIDCVADSVVLVKLENSAVQCDGVDIFIGHIHRGNGKIGDFVEKVTIRNALTFLQVSPKEFEKIDETLKNIKINR